MNRVERQPATTYPLATRSKWHLLALIGIALFFLAGGIGHFALARFFVAIVPGYVPWPTAMVAVSGACELAGALGLLWPATRYAAGIGLLLLIVAVFPANVNMALHPQDYPALPGWLFYARLPLQPVLLGWAAFAMRRAAP